MTKHQPATPLPWLHNDTTRRPLPLHYYARICGEEGRDAETIAVVPCHDMSDTSAAEDAAYIAHAANAYPKLVQALKGALNIYALQALRDCADPKMLEGWRKNQESVKALLRELGEEA